MATLYSRTVTIGGLALLGLVGLGSFAPANARDLTQPAQQPTIEDVMRERAHQLYEESLGQSALNSRTEAAAKGEIRGVTAPVTAGPLRCLPTCDTADGRFLAIAGSGFDTLSPPELNLSIGVPAGATSFEVGVFDGDGSEYNADGITYYWDSGATALFEYALYADPDANGTGTIPVDLAPGSPTILSNAMPDNDWIDFTVNTGSEAASPSGNFFYVLKVRLAAPTLVTLNAFKVRTTAVLSGTTLDPVARPFSYLAAWSGFDDLAVIYPDFPATTNTTYDGTFNFYFDVPVGQDELTVWDGDFDHGKYDLTELDTDDPDTPFLFLPPWATLDTRPEGIAIGGLGTGSPPDDENINGFFGEYILREPSVKYHLVAPDGQDFNNPNPSGNQEWEQFKISTAPFNPLLMDAHTSSLPPGTYRLEIQGIDMLNLNALLLPFRLLCVEENGVACVPLRPFLVGDTVFLDQDGDGVQDAGEAGIEGVTVELRDSHGSLLDTTTTAADGTYRFGVDKAAYEVRIPAANFAGGGALEGFTSTSGGESQTGTVTNDNILTFDFGYAGGGSLSGLVWEDKDADGVQDAGELGFPDVTVQLIAADNSVADTTTTASDGTYTFNPAAGTYKVRIVTSTLPAGAAQTFDIDGTATANEASVTLASGQDKTGVNFGYRGTASLGDRVWNDVNGNGVQDSGEAGLNGVTVRLLDSGGDVIATTTTTGNGNFTFSNLLNGSYTVAVDASTLPSGYQPTFDSDGVSTPNQSSVAISDAGGAPTSVDFGYRASAQITLGDRVWNDANGNGVQDSTEAGINGVTVQLLNSSGTVIATTATAGNGNYSFANLATGTYTVRVVSSTLPAGATATFDADGIATLHTATVTNATASNANLDFGYKLPAKISIGDRVWNDADGDGVQDSGEAGIANVTVQLLSSSGTVIASQVTNSSGNYSFTNLDAGTYKVKVASGIPSGYVQTYDADGLATPNIATVTASANVTNIDFGYRCSPKISLGDRVWKDVDGDGVQDSGEPGIAGVTVKLLNSSGTVIATKTTDSNGMYSFTNLDPGTYTIQITAGIPSGYVPTYDLDGISTPNKVSGEATTSYNIVDFGYKETVKISIGNRVWKDTDGDGVQDSGEPGIKCVTVKLLNSSGTVVATTTTDDNGYYTFSNLSPGTYTVQVASGIPSGYTPTWDRDGISTANKATVTNANTNLTDVDFGYKEQTTVKISIGNRVWKDNDGDGNQDSSEPGIKCVTVQLLNSSGAVIATKTTDDNGYYSFTNLTPGTYKVKVVTSTLPSGYAPTYDADGLSTKHIATVTANSNVTHIDFGYRNPNNC